MPTEIDATAAAITSGSEAPQGSLWVSDLVIRVNPGPDARLVGRIFMRDRLVVVASPKLKRPAGKALNEAFPEGSAQELASFLD